MAFQSFLNEHLTVVFVNILTVLGMLKILGWIWSFLCSMWRQVFRPCCQSKNRLYQMYGRKDNMIENTWAVITGGSDGIGLGMSKNLASQGFNICIVSRSEKKINEKLEEIRKECRDGDKDFKTMCIPADFWKLQTIAEYRSVIADRLQDLDVGVLVLNAGFAQVGPFVDLKDDEVEKQVQVNTNHVIYLAKAMIKQLVDRFDNKKKKSGIVITSSIASIKSVAGITTYNATKSFDAFMAEGLNYELKGKVDVIAYKPAGVATKMIKEDKPSLFTIMPDKAANKCFRDLGIKADTNGSFAHEIVANMFEATPASLANKGCYEECKKELQKQREEEAATAKQNDEANKQAIN